MRDGSLVQRRHPGWGLVQIPRGVPTPKVMTQTRPHSPCRDRNTLRTSIPTKRPTECAPLPARRHPGWGLVQIPRGVLTPKVMTQTRPHSPCRDRNTLRTSIPTKRPTECAPLPAPACTQTSLGTWLEPTGRSRRRAKVMPRNSTFYLNWLVGGRSRIRTYDPLIKSSRSVKEINQPSN